MRHRTKPHASAVPVMLAAPDPGAATRTTHTLIVSDVHLGLRTSRPGTLLETLRGWRFERLILLGDIVHDGVQHRLCGDSWAVLRHLRHLAQSADCEVVCLHGNHDRHLAPWLAMLLGVEIRDSFAFTLGGRRFLAVHGDRFDWFNHRLARIGNAIGRAYAFAQHRLSRDGGWPSRLERLYARLGGLDRRVGRRAAAYARDHGADVIVCGHTHRPGSRTFGGEAGERPVIYVNAGCWVDEPASYVTIAAAGFDIRHI